MKVCVPPTVCLLCLLSLLGCDDRVVQLVRDRVDAAPDAASDASQHRDAQQSAQCGDQACACDNGVDDDNDGLSDGFDPECTGASDNDEGSFATGTPQPIGPCRDCFFDNDTASDNDQCAVHVACIDEGAAPPVEGLACAECGVSKKCKDNCRPLTPNGCDCFGCCTIDIQGQPKVNIRLQDSCALDVLDDEVACPRCVPNDACRNPCGRCELCPGRTEADLPADCADKPMGPKHQCEDREAVCDDTTPCAGDYYCLQGCCLPIVVE